MDYPGVILPNNNYKIIECDLSNCNLIRHTIDKNIWDDDLEMILDKAICHPKSNMNDLSTSLLGVFIIDYVFLKLTDIGHEVFSQYCPPDCFVDTPIFNEHFVIDDSRGYWFINIFNIKDIKAEYNHNNDKLTATCKICHTPMKWNYWHFSIRWFLDDKNCFWNDLGENEKKKGWSERLAHETRSLIRMFAIKDLPNDNILDIQFYCKQA